MRTEEYYNDLELVSENDLHCIAMAYDDELIYNDHNIAQMCPPPEDAYQEEEV